MLTDLLSSTSSLRNAVRDRLQGATFSFQTLQTLRYELHLAKVRMRNAVHPLYRQERARLARLDDVKLHWGCGSRILDGWVNVDGFPAPGIDHTMDLRGPLPFRDNTVRYIFTEHVLEHVEAHHGRRILQEFYRVLKPGGTARIIVPDLKAICESYIHKDLDFFRKVLHVNDVPAVGVNNVFYGHFHRCMYDFDSLAAALREAGFSHVEHSSHLGSAVPELNLDTDKESRWLVSLYVEARK